MAERERFEVVYKNLERMTLIPRSPYVPQTFPDWIQHRSAFNVMMALEQKKRIADREALHTARLCTGGQPALIPFSGKLFKDHRSAVLSQPTIWCHWSEPEQLPSWLFKQVASWPSKEEMKEEGDERYTSGFCRFLALPRVPGNETVVWKQKRTIASFPLDSVWELPTLEAEIPPPNDENMEFLVGETLLRELDGRKISASNPQMSTEQFCANETEHTSAVDESIALEECCELEAMEKGLGDNEGLGKTA
ncbi:hypothetical protein MMC20_004030 [Loxospora ochrophaea]|nr:hypothetical protein [Loxospora ochrophaea]